MAFVPTVSIIIPMYNAERYIAECLESLLAQTFRNFEVIIVDDCSTDSSCAIVESYRERFGGRLTLSHMEQNTGSGALPRNRGLMLSRGEYVFFADADDKLAETAIEKLHTLAESFNADVVYCDRHFKMNSDGSNPRVKNNQLTFPLVDKPTLDPDDLSQRIQILTKHGYWVVPWNKFLRRRLLIEHEIFFPHCVIAEDNVWTYTLIFRAKNFLRVPDTVYFYRDSEDSMLRKEKSPQQTINFRFNPILLGLKALDGQLGKLEFFRQNPAQRYAVLEFFFRNQCYGFLMASFKLKSFEVYETIQQNFGDRLGDFDVLIPMLCSSLNYMQKLFAVKHNEFAQFTKSANNRIAKLEAELKQFKS